MPLARTSTVGAFCRRATISLMFFAVCLSPAVAQETLPWKSDNQRVAQDDRDSNSGYGSGSTYNSGPVVRNAPHEQTSEPNQNGAQPRGRNDQGYEYYEKLPPENGRGDGSYRAPQQGYDYEDRRRPSGEAYRDGPERGYEEPGTYSQSDIKSAGHKFFGSVSQGLANIIEYAFQKSGRPNGYILGEDAGGAFFAGLRYGEGRLYTRDAGTHRVYWQGPSIGYDFGGEGSKTMILVYNLRDPSEIYHRFGGVQGSAYLVGGVSIQFQQHGNVVLAPIRSGVGLRLGANVGYLKYTRYPTWNPF